MRSRFTRLQLLARRIQRKRRVRPLAHQMLRAIGNLRVLLDEQPHVILIATRGRAANHLLQEVHCRRRPHSADHAQLERPLRRREMLRHDVRGIHAVRIDDRHAQRRAADPPPARAPSRPAKSAPHPAPPDRRTPRAAAPPDAPAECPCECRHRHTPPRSPDRGHWALRGYRISNSPAGKYASNNRCSRTSVVASTPIFLAARQTWRARSAAAPPSCSPPAAANWPSALR